MRMIWHVMHCQDVSSDYSRHYRVCWVCCASVCVQSVLWEQIIMFTLYVVMLFVVVMMFKFHNDGLMN